MIIAGWHRDNTSSYASDGIFSQHRSIMEIASIGMAGLFANALGIRPVFYLGGALLLLPGLLGLLQLGRYRFQTP